MIRNVADAADLPPTSPSERDRSRRRALTVDETDVMRAAWAGTRLEALWVTILGLALRPPEARALTWDDIDLDEDVVHVRAMIRTGDDGLPERGPAKTARSVRSLRAPAPVIEALRRHRARQVEECLAGLWPNDWQSDLVFVSETETVLDPSNVRRDLAAVAD